ncbi:MAG: hypothetical protein AAFX94_14780 [Myxococcota bacterium]
MGENSTPEEQADLVGLEDDPKWGAVLDELDGELSTQVTAMEFDDEWSQTEGNASKSKTETNEG